MTGRMGNTHPDTLAVQRWRFDACLERRNRAEFMAGGIVMVFLIVSGVIGFSGSTSLPDTIAALGLILVAAGLGVTLWRLKRHVAAQRREPSDMNPKAAFVGRLKRERDLLRSVWGWYIGPMLPGFVLVWGSMFAGGSVGTAVVGTAITVIAVAWVAYANRRAAAEFDDQLHEIDPAMS